MLGEDGAYEPADVEPTAWGTAWEQQMDKNAAAEGNEAQENGLSAGKDDWETAMGAAHNDWGAATGAGGGPSTWADDVRGPRGFIWCRSSEKEVSWRQEWSQKSSQERSLERS